MTAIRISAPEQAQQGEIIELKAMIRHDMESGYRRNAYGEAIPRQIIKHFECRYNGEIVFAAEFFPGVAANPFLSFFTRATVSGTLEFLWVDQDGSRQSQVVDLIVS